MTEITVCPVNYLRSCVWQRLLFALFLFASISIPISGMAIWLLDYLCIYLYVWELNPYIPIIESFYINENDFAPRNFCFILSICENDFYCEIHVLFTLVENCLISITLSCTFVCWRICLSLSSNLFRDWGFLSFCSVFATGCLLFL